MTDGQNVTMVYFHKNWRLRRSVLFMPSSNRRALEKAPTLECDGVIFDLEESVAEADRDQAHRNLRDLLKGRDFGKTERIIRLSESNSQSFDSDFEVAVECEPHALLLPKVQSADDILAMHQRLENAGAAKNLQIWAMIETATALINLTDISATGNNSRLNCLVVGPNDLAKETGVKNIPGRTYMLPWFMQALAAARAFDLCILDGVYNNFRDLDGLEAECIQGASMGYDGKTLIHPSQIGAANEHFGATRQDIDRARMIIGAFQELQNQGKAAIQIDGEMYEGLHLRLAEKLIASLPE